MLSTFPTLLSWSELAPTMIRITLGLVLLYWAFKTFTSKSVISKDGAVAAIEALAGALLIIGLYTQIAALVIMVDLLVRSVRKIMSRAFFTSGINYYFILLIMALSLLVSGAGLLAFDLPL